MTSYMIDRWAAAGPNASIDANLVALVKSGTPTNSDRVAGQQRFCLDAAKDIWYYHDGGATTSWRVVGHLAGDRGPWVANTYYVIGDIVSRSGNIYRCGTANSDSSFTPTNWVNLSASGGSNGGGNLPPSGGGSFIEVVTPYFVSEKQTGPDSTDVSTTFTDLYKTGTTVLETPSVLIHDISETWLFKCAGVTYCGAGFVNPIGVEIKLQYATADSQTGTYSSWTDTTLGLIDYSSPIGPTIFRSKIAAGTINSTAINQVSGSGRGGGGFTKLSESNTNTATRTTFVDVGINWPSTVSDDDMLAIYFDNTSNEQSSAASLIWGQQQRSISVAAAGDSPSSTNSLGFPAGADDADYWYVGRSSSGDLLLANTSGLSSDGVIVALWEVKNADPITTSSQSGVALLSGTQDNAKYRDYSPAIEVPVPLSTATSATVGKWIKFKIQFRKPDSVFPDINSRYGWYIALSATKITDIRIPNAIGTVNIPIVTDIDRASQNEWLRYAANNGDAPTTNAGFMAITDNKAIALDATTGKSYVAAVTAAGSWSTAADATLHNANYGTGYANTIYNVSSTNTGWATLATESGSIAFGGWTTIGSTIWGICVVRSGTEIHTFTKNGSGSWEVWNVGDVVIQRWSEMPAGSIRIIDQWGGEVGKRNQADTQEEHWYFVTNDEGLASGNAQSQTRTPQGVEDWRSAENPDVRGNPPGGVYTAVATAATTDSVGEIHYDTSTRTLTIYPKSGDEAWFSEALKQNGRIEVRTGSSSLINGVISTGVTWSNQVATVIIDAHDLYVSNALTTGTTYTIESHGLYMTWRDYSTSPLPKSDSLFGTIVGDVHRYDSGLSDSPTSTKRGLVWKVGEHNLVVYDEDNVQWTNTASDVTTFGTWGTMSAPTLATNIDTLTENGLYRVSSTSTGTKPTDTNTSTDFVLVQIGGGQWEYQLAWIKRYDLSTFSNFSYSTNLIGPATARVFETDGTTYVGVEDEDGKDRIQPIFITGNTVEVWKDSSNHFIGQINIVAASDDPDVSLAASINNPVQTGSFAHDDTIQVRIYATQYVFRARQVVSSGGSYSFTGVPWTYSNADRILYFDLGEPDDLNSEATVSKNYGVFDTTVTNEPSSQAGKRGIMFQTGGYQQVAFLDNVAAHSTQTYTYQRRTYSTAATFQQSNWHNVPGLDTTSISYNLAFSRKLVNNRHPARGELAFFSSSNQIIINGYDKVGTSTVYSPHITSIGHGSIIQIEQPANGRRWTGAVTQTTQEFENILISCSELGDRGSSGFFIGSEIKLFCNALGSSNYLTSNINTIADAYNGQWVWFPSNATGAPWTESGILFQSPEWSGVYFVKQQRAFSEESLKTAQRSEIHTAGAWSTAANATDLITLSTHDLNNPVIDNVVIITGSASNTPSGLGASEKLLVFTITRTDTTLAQVLIADLAIYYRTAPIATPKSLGAWITGEPTSAEMRRIPDQANGFLSPHPVSTWMWFKESGTLTDAPSLPGTNQYGITRILPGDNEQTYINEVYFRNATTNTIQKTTQTVVESWGTWSYSPVLPKIEHSTAEQNITSTEEVSFENITFTPQANQKYLIQVSAMVDLTRGSRSDSDNVANLHTFSLRQDSGSNTGTSGTLRDEYEFWVRKEQIEIESALHLQYIYTAGANPSAETFHFTIDMATYLASNHSTVSSIQMRVEEIQ